MRTVSYILSYFTLGKKVLHCNLSSSDKHFTSTTTYSRNILNLNKKLEQVKMVPLIIRYRCVGISTFTKFQNIIFNLFVFVNASIRSNFYLSYLVHFDPLK